MTWRGLLPRLQSSLMIVAPRGVLLLFMLKLDKTLHFLSRYLGKLRSLLVYIEFDGLKLRKMLTTINQAVVTVPKKHIKGTCATQID